ncbi:MAG: hypothetical protein JXB39_12470, partial [Deltaproteobacteria bacterium]|nr:hypothetical protein [Deltaproteobacteria bacterium]
MLLVLLLAACADDPAPTRAESLEGRTRVDPSTDPYPPVLAADFEALFEDPVPVPGGVNTAGAEDSPFVADGGLYFFFTPDPGIPAEQQVLDGVTGIWWISAGDGATGDDEARVVLADEDAMDGCPTFHRGTLWFCSIRAGNVNEIDWWTAACDGPECEDWANAGERVNTEIRAGELHLTDDALWFGAERDGGHGGQDLWRSAVDGDSFEDPVNLGPAVNDAGTQVMPWVAPDGSELWFTGTSALGHPGPALWRSTWEADAWTEAREVVSSFAGEPTVDPFGNVWFVHHYFTDGPDEMIEADLFVA